MLTIILSLWQLPQTLLGLIILAIFGAQGYIVRVTKIKTSWIFWTKAPNFTGISLGPIIILDDKRFANDSFAQNHEYGHCVQSFIFGPLYLLIIGLPSLVLNNLLWSLVHKERPYKYYTHYPEDWADKLGGVIGRYK